MSSPFIQIICLDFYDGMISGVMKCRVCKKVLLFETISWSEKERVRIYGLRPLPNDSHSILTALFSEHSVPTEPIWAPTMQFENPEQERLVNQAVDAVLDKAGPIELIVASEDLSKTLVAVREFDLANAEKYQAMIVTDITRDSSPYVKHWLSFLGMSSTN